MQPRNLSALIAEPLFYLSAFCSPLAPKEASRQRGMGDKGSRRDASVLEPSAADLPWIEIEEGPRPRVTARQTPLRSVPSGALAPSHGAELEVGETPAVLAVAEGHRTGRRTH